MGLKERLVSLKGRDLITSFVAAETLDSVMTAIAINNFQATEISPFGGRELMNNLEQTEVFILKTALTAIAIGTYALASSDFMKDFKIKIKSSEIKPKYVTEKALQGANIFAWGVVAFNTVQITPEIIRALS